MERPAHTQTAPLMASRLGLLSCLLATMLPSARPVRVLRAVAAQRAACRIAFSPSRPPLMLPTCSNRRTNSRLLMSAAKPTASVAAAADAASKADEDEPSVDEPVAPAACAAVPGVGAGDGEVFGLERPALQSPSASLE